MLPSSIPTFSPIANVKAIVLAGNARFTILEERIIRMEYDPQRRFEDRASQVIWYRDQPVPEFSVRREGDCLTIETNALLLTYHIVQRFREPSLAVSLKETNRTWHYGDVDHTNLKGTFRTLDSFAGAVELEQGLISRSGWSVIDDSNSLVFDKTGWLEPRERSLTSKDIYFFGFGHRYLEAIQAYQKLSGKPELLPRYALGNWWSRFWPYTQEELLGLMQDFMTFQVPLSVCIVDMDWHITKTGNKSSGWTGYTWNRELFPNPGLFIDELHQMNLKTALNLHPAQGIHPHEEVYPAMCEALGQDPETNKPVEFDIASKQFTKAYFDLIHHPMQVQGIDFWWMDWQQGTRSKTVGLDPLFWLNHLHYYDLGRKSGDRPFIFSRWPGLGGHRYPIGFSGDTITSWESLAFQPYFTATASNVAYGWWSHDIGGHYQGIEEAELYLRWVQFGVFSPILRLHSTNNAWCERRPWGFDFNTLEYASEAMRLRHAIVPLIYSANQRNAEQGEPITLPMYYNWPEENNAYICPNQYQFCHQLIVSPFIQKMDPQTGMTRQPIWLPQGDWYHFQTGEYYRGNGWYGFYGELGDLPVFAKGGAIIPLANDGPINGTANPTKLLVRVFGGKENSYDLYEDDGQSQKYKHGQFTITRLDWQKQESGFSLFKHPVEGAFKGMPKKRTWDFELIGLTRPESITLKIDEQPESMIPFGYDEDRHAVLIGPISLPASEAFSLMLVGSDAICEGADVTTRVRRMIDHALLPSRLKEVVMRRLPDLMTNPTSFWDLLHEFTPTQLLALFETVFNQQDKPIVSDAMTAYRLMTGEISTLLGS
ncbi:MAG: TIM-barrel domain-containing protein [Anaerolineaceae bacterium]